MYKDSDMGLAPPAGQGLRILCKIIKFWSIEFARLFL